MKKESLLTSLVIIHAALSGVAGAAYTLTISSVNGRVDVMVCDPNDPDMWIQPDDPTELTFDAGAEVQLVPRPHAGYSFRSWSGDDVRRGWAFRRRLSVTMDDDKSITANFDTWEAPIGVPAPSFGITETYRMYDDPGNRNPTLPYNQNAEGGYYTHYIHFDDPNATDVDNPYGTIAKPRKTIPYDSLSTWHHYVVPLEPGMVMEIHGTLDMLGIRPDGWLHGYLFTEGGTEEMPAFIRGGDSDNLISVLPASESDAYGTRISGNYIVCENFAFNNSLLRMFDASHSVIRNCEVSGVVRVSGQAATIADSSDCIFYGNRIHHNWGTWEDDSKDMHNVAVVLNCKRIWVVDNHLHHASYKSNGTMANTGGDAIQVVMGTGCTDVNNLSTWPSYIYIGRNVMHHNTENSADIKCSNHVVITQNESSWDGFIPYAGEGAMINHENAHNTWFIFNTIHDVRVGIRPEDAQGDAWVIGNVIYNIKYPVESGTIYGNFVGGVWARIVQTHIVGNTFYNVVGGALIPQNTGNCNIINNIVSRVPVPYEDNLSWYHAGVENNRDAHERATLDYNVFHQPDGVDGYTPEGTIRLRWGSSDYDGLASFQAATAQGLNCLEADPLFVDASEYALHPSEASPAIDSGTSEGIVRDIMDTYYATFGVSIECDIEGTPRPRGSAWDIGAYEYSLSPVSSVAVSGMTQNSVTMTWTVPGGDGSSDQPGRYDILYATSAITEANWEAATEVSGEPVPGEPGEAESFTLTGLEPGTTYYVAIKTSNDAETTVSDLSNVVSATTTESGNRAPVFDSIGDQLAMEGTTFSLVVSATDADAGDTLSYSAPVVPSGATFTSATRTFTWTPAYEQIGTHYATFEVTDGQVSVSETIAITVSSGSNHPPVLGSIGNKSVDEGDTLSFSVTATDVDGQSLTYSAGSLPSGATFSGQTFTWTPGFTQAGSHNVTFTVSDGSAQDSETISISVGNSNRAPVLAAVSDQSVNENALLTFSVSGTDPDGDSVSYSATNVPSGANFVGGTFSWVPTFNQAGSYTVTFTATDGGLTDSDQATIVVANVNDTTAPVASATYPEAGAIQVPLNALIEVAISDSGWGIDANTVELQVDGQVVYSGDTASYNSDSGTCQRTGTEASYALHYQPDDEFDFDQQVAVNVNASDQANNVMTPYAYTFTTEMRAFGGNKVASWVPSETDKACAATACDSDGTIWVAYEAGEVGQRDIYISHLTAEAEYFSSPVQLTTDTGDQCHPGLAIGSDDKLYVVWQDDRQSNWDVYGRTSTDGTTWSSETRITESDDHQITPVIAVDEISDTAWIAWQEYGSDGQNLYVASSSNDFLATSTAKVTLDATTPTTPAVAVDASGVVYVIWTDARNGSNDIYGAASDTGPWTNVPIAAGSGNEHSPCVATEAEGSQIHFVWVDETSGDSDICYASSEGMPSSALAGTTIVDDTSGAGQVAPSLSVAGSTGTDLDVFVCWQDSRNVGASGIDTDLYFIDLRTGNETNILVGDGGTRSGQSEPVLGIDDGGHPYVVWTDGRNVDTGIYYAASSRTDSEEQESNTITASTGGTVGDTSPTAVGDVSVVIPAGACSHDVTISIAEILNPQFASSSTTLAYEFSPSGLEFSTPVTIAIPYVTADFPDATPIPYWYDPQTATLTQEGITEIESVVISDTISALRFKVAHFTAYGLFDSVVDGADDGGGGGGGGGGGCALSPTGQGEWLGFLLPYLAIAGTVMTLRWRDRRLQRDVDR